ncbi:MAG: Transporter, CPA2 family [Candidatus Wolfebacteria bacterium GW2011_GWA2_47_9b]|uniref:Transporter, CPA2 family n=1 Tax=Candidatus Wolfebacteria bacterium GW2011_GWA2_47_9b TaxID=1619005 RepID=A0A0G1U8K6_9BACT|nr:MAG: Transporter, CPA2 family [Candidatus Wolfebacteria bacterium GW2011_GWA2_47_9b]
MGTGILELAVVVLIATMLGIIARLFKQPLILAFIGTGIIISHLGLFHLNNAETLRIFSDLGIMFLLFLVGLEIDFKSLKLIGKPSFVIGGAQIALTFALGFLLSTLFHFSPVESAYIAIALTLSSTVIVIKMLSEKKDTGSLYGKLSVGLLLIQDMVVILILVLLSGIASGTGFMPMQLALTIGKAALLFGATILIGRKVIPVIFDKIALSQELTFFSSLSWAFIVAATVSHPAIGFPIEVGGLLAGISLSSSSHQFQIVSKIKYLRDFFILIFLVILGSSLVFTSYTNIILPLMAFTLFVLIIKPLVILAIMGAMGYRKKTSFFTGMTIAQVSEFSLVLASIGMKLGHLSTEIVAIITGATILSIAVSTYLVTHAEPIYQRLIPLLSLFQRKNLSEKISEDEEFAKPIILIGAHRIGQSIAFNLKKEDVLVIDFDPEIIHFLKKYGYTYLFGDIDDEEILEKANLHNARLVISTTSDFKNNDMLIKEVTTLKKQGCNIKIIVRSDDEKEVERLYQHGADYVIFPHFTSGQYLGRSIAIDPHMKLLDDLKEWDLKLIKKLSSHVE